MRIILHKGKGTLLAKLDLESAYCILPVHPDDRPLLGMEWKDQIYVDAAISSENLVDYEAERDQRTNSLPG